MTAVLATGAPRPGVTAAPRRDGRGHDREGRGPQVLPDEHSGGASGLHGGCELVHVLRRQQFRKLGFDRMQLAEFTEVGKLCRLDGPVSVLGEDQDVVIIMPRSGARERSVIALGIRSQGASGEARP
jgi:hypothetical protein